MLTIEKLAKAVHRQFYLIIGSILLIFVLVAAMSAFIIYLEVTQIQNSAREAKSLATILADETDRSTQSVSLILQRVAARLESAGIDTPASLELAASAVDFRAFLNDSLAEDGSLDSVYVVSAKQYTGPRYDAGLTLTDIHARDQLSALEGAEPNAVYLSSPFRSRTTGAWQLSLTTRVSAKDGGFLGIVSAVVNLSSFTDLLGKLALGEHASVSVIRDDGEIIACYPPRELSLGSIIAETPIFRDLISKKRNGVTRQVSDVDHIERLFAVVNSDRFPVASVVALAMDDALAAWWFQAEALGLGTVVIVVVILFGAVRFALRVEQLAEAREREAVEAQSAIQYTRFNNAMDNIVQGLAMYDRSGALAVCNRRYAEIYGLPVDLARQAGIGVRALAKSDDPRFGKSVDQPRRESDGSSLAIAELPDGRIIAQRKKGLADGGWVSTHEDITARRRAEEKIQVMAIQDALTGLLNRFGFKQRLEQCLSEAKRRTGHFAVLYLDLDRFKSVNDTLGHPVGDKLLREVAARICGVVRKSDTTARLGGDEFAIIQRVSVLPRDAIRLADRLIAAIAQPFTIDGAHIEIGTSIGIALTPDDSVDVDDILRVADLALYHSKSSRGVYHFFQASMDQEFRLKRQTEDELRTALAEGQFEVHFQPIASVNDRRVTAFEALLRWQHPTRGQIAPGEFISLAEENGLIVPIGEWVLRVASKEAAKWPDSVSVAVNVSALQFKTSNFSKIVFEALEVSGLPGSRLIIELTESVLMKDTEFAISTLKALRSGDIKIAMDDFGTGYSSLSYMRQFPFDKIKIDRAFIAELGVREDSTAIVRAATGLARALGMQTVAEGIETEEQLTQARIEGCSEAQGYLLGRPMPAHEALAFLGINPDDASGRVIESDLPSRPAVATAQARGLGNVTPFRPRDAPIVSPRASERAGALRPITRSKI